MSGLNALKIALSGIGSAALTIALSGFVPDAPATPPTTPVAAASEGGGGHRRHVPGTFQTRAEQERRLREDDEAVVLAIVAFVLGGEQSG